MIECLFRGELDARKVVFQSATGANLLVTGEMKTFPRVGEKFTILGRTYVVDHVEHTISDGLAQHQIWVTMK
jgi:hypothetical protein